MAKNENAITALGEIRGLLHAFEWFNNKVNYGPTFTLESLPQHALLDDALWRYFDGDAIEIKTTPIDNWQNHLRSVFSKWLFEYRDLIVPSAVGSANDATSQQEMVNYIIDRFRVAFQPRAAWKVDVKLHGFYELFWDDIVLECDDGSYFLHLGMSD